MSMDLVHDITAAIPEVASVKAEALPTPAKVALLRKMWGEKPPANPDCANPQSLRHAAPSLWPLLTRTLSRTIAVLTTTCH